MTDHVFVSSCYKCISFCSYIYIPPFTLSSTPYLPLSLWTSSSSYTITGPQMFQNINTIATLTQQTFYFPSSCLSHQLYLSFMIKYLEDETAYRWIAQLSKEVRLPCLPTQMHPKTVFPCWAAWENDHHRHASTSAWGDLKGVRHKWH